MSRKGARILATWLFGLAMWMVSSSVKWPRMAGRGLERLCTSCSSGTSRSPSQFWANNC